VSGGLPKRFTDDEVRAIREEYAKGGVRQVDLAARYGVAQTTISTLLAGVTYRWVS
jgi:predicted transcriptional regulator